MGRYFYNRSIHDGQLNPMPCYADSLAGRRRMVISGPNQTSLEQHRMSAGRRLSGFGSIGDPSHASCLTNKLEEQDDSYGSGIFDAGFKATANADMGIYSSNYQLPGYLGREVPYAVSREVTDITDDADVVYVPGGGMTYTNIDGTAVSSADVLGPTPRPPLIRPNLMSPTCRDQPYKDLTQGSPLRQPAHANAPVRATRPSRGPARRPALPPPQSLSRPVRTVARPSQEPVSMREVVSPEEARIAVHTTRAAQTAPVTRPTTSRGTVYQASPEPLPTTSRGTVSAPPRLAISKMSLRKSRHFDRRKDLQGFGVEGEGAGEEGMGLVGWALVGAAAGALVGYGQKKRWFK